MITIIDYGVGNIASVQKAFEHLGAPTEITSDRNKIAAAKILVIPGQGAFQQALDSLTKKDLIAPIKSHITDKKPFLGVCLGFQILFEFSEEDGGHSGLGIFKGNVTKIQESTLKVPHMGWNTLEVSPHHKAKLPSLGKEEQAYFVHSYYVLDAHPNDTATTTSYGKPFVSAVIRDKTWGTQFHPEKSGAVGLGILKDFLNDATRN